MTVTEQKQEEIKRSGYGISGDIGGIGKQTYYTPDGRRIRAVPSERDYVLKDKDGKVIESGIRDANYDKGWLPIMPRNPAPHCDGCDNWHSTEEEVSICIAKRRDDAEKWEKWAKEKQKGEAFEQGKEMESMRIEMLELKGMVHELTQALKEKV